ncbi:MAG: hypothetical protein AAF456_01770 [Planctomycetota bacterium]
MTSILPSVRARLKERFIFNFRLHPDVMQDYLPVDWLKPDEVRGHAIATFCVLDLSNITVSPLPAVAGFSSVSCAQRYAVLDSTFQPAEPAVFVADRYTNSAFGSWFTKLGFSAPHPYAKAVVSCNSGITELVIEAENGDLLCSAEFEISDNDESAVFDVKSFAAFISKGVKSYGPSRHGDRLTKVDLLKDDTIYQPLTLRSIKGAAVDDWKKNGGVFDSAYRTTGGVYEWQYHGMTAGE